MPFRPHEDDRSLWVRLRGGGDWALSSRAWTVAGTAGLLIGGILLGRATLLVHNPASIVGTLLLLALAAVVYRLWGVPGLLTAYAGTLWYPLVLNPLSAFGGPFTAGLQPADACILVLGISSAIRGWNDPQISRALRVIAIVVVTLVVGWLLTFAAAPLSATFPEFRQLLVVFSLVTACVVYVRDTVQALAVCVAASVSIVIQHWIILWGQRVGGIPFYSPSIGSQDSLGIGRLFGTYVLPGASPVSVWGSRAGGVIAVGLCVGLCLWIWGTVRMRLVGAGLVALLAAPALFTGARAGWIAFTIGAVVALVVAARGDLARPAAILRASLIICAAGVLVETVSGKLNAELQARLGDLTSFRWLDPTVSWRARYYRLALGEWVKHPFGAGFDVLAREHIGFDHNTYTILLNGVGLLGLLAFVVFLVWMAREWVRTVRHPRVASDVLLLCGISSLVAVAVAALAENTFFLSSAPWAVWGCALALALRAAARPRARGIGGAHGG